MADVFKDLLEEKLDGYIALTDGIIDVILNMVWQLHDTTVNR